VSSLRLGLAGALDEAKWWLGSHAVWLVLALVILAGAVGGITLWASARGRASLVPVPDVVGMSPGPARVLLTSKGLGYRQVGSKPSEKTASGLVLTQDPAANSRAVSATVIKVVLSEGPSHVVVPDVTQMSVAQAQLQLQAAGLAAGVVREAYHPTVPREYVASALPIPGARVVKGTAVDMVVSLGPQVASPLGPPAPDSPTPGRGREETLAYQVPADAGDGDEVEVLVQVHDSEGSRTVYHGLHRPGDRIPPQKLTISIPTTARILVDGEVRAERQYLP
jgi:beta-lactam-binding protein with PASTA domain